MKSNTTKKKGYHFLTSLITAFCSHPNVNIKEHMTSSWFLHFNSASKITSFALGNSFHGECRGCKQVSCKQLAKATPEIKVLQCCPTYAWFPTMLSKHHHNSGRHNLESIIEFHFLETSIPVIKCTSRKIPGIT